VYTALGMQRKVRALEQAHPGLRGAQLRLTGSTGNTAAEVLDVTAIVKATRAISGELELDRLLARMLEIIFENAGAEGGALVLDDRCGLTVAASRTAGAAQISTAAIPLAGAAFFLRLRIDNPADVPGPAE
jgi:histidine kinase